MRVTIIKEGDQARVVVGGASHPVPAFGLPANFHALQWDGASGEVEYAMTTCDHCGTRSKKPNETVTDFAPYQAFVDGWQVAQAGAEEAAKKASADVTG